MRGWTPPPKGLKKDNREECETFPLPRGFCSHRDQTGGAYSCWGYNPDFLGPPNPIDQLVAALHDAGLNTAPKYCKCHGLDPDSDSDSDGKTRPRVKIPPPIFKGLPWERPDAHLLATED